MRVNFVGCAGGIDTTARFKYKPKKADPPESYPLYRTRRNGDICDYNEWEEPMPCSSWDVS